MNLSEIPSIGNRIRCAVVELARFNQDDNIKHMVAWELYKGRSIERLALFAQRQFAMSYNDAVTAISVLVPEKLN